MNALLVQERKRKNMNIWVTITLIAAAIVFAIDYLLRRKKWEENSKEEKISLAVNMFSVGPYLFLSAIGMLWGIASSSPETALGETLFDVTLILAGIYFIVAIVAVIGSIIFRKIRKIKVSIWINVIAFIYIVVVLTVNFLVGELL